MRTVMEKSAVVITGVGAATSLGSDFATFAANLLAGKSPARAITRRFLISPVWAGCFWQVGRWIVGSEATGRQCARAWRWA